MPNERQSVGYLKLPAEDAEALKQAAQDNDRTVIGQAIHYVKQGLLNQRKQDDK